MSVGVSVGEDSSYQVVFAHTANTILSYDISKGVWNTIAMQGDDAGYGEARDCNSRECRKAVAVLMVQPEVVAVATLDFSRFRT